MKKYLLLLAALLLLANGILMAVPAMVLFKDVVAKGDTTSTCRLILEEAPSYPVGFVLTPKAERWLIQLYKDGGDGIISPLDSLGRPTGDDIAVTDSINYKGTQGVLLPVPYSWNPPAYVFPARGDDGQTTQGDKVYLRIFNNTTIKKADKYIVAHTLFTVPKGNVFVQYSPAFGWDKRGWITFRNLNKEKH